MADPSSQPSQATTAAAPHDNPSTPYKPNPEARLHYLWHLFNAQDLKRALGLGMNGSLFGPPSPKSFLTRFMPIAQAILDAMPKDVKFSCPDKVEDERVLYDLFSLAITEYGISPNFKFYISGDGKKNIKNVLYRPDGSFEDYPVNTVTNYEGGEARKSAQAASPQPSNEASGDSKDTGRNQPQTVNVRPVNWWTDGLVVEFKREASADPFFTRNQIDKAHRAVEALRAADPQNTNIPPVSFTKSTDAHVINQGQLSLYATKTFTHQHRTHLFQLLICGRLARFLMWDHSGAIVSDAFDYVAKPDLLAGFVWRYNHMTAQARGYDPNAQLASSAECATFQEKAKELLAELDKACPRHPQYASFLPGATVDEGWPVYKFTVKDTIDPAKQNEVLLRRPIFWAHGAVGRGTRGYIVYDINDCKLRFLKITWRVVHDRLVQERTILGDLRNAGIVRVPEVFCGGDVAGGAVRTRAKEWMEMAGSSAGFAQVRQFQQHVLLEELALPVQVAPNSLVYTQVFLDVFVALGTAHSKCKVSHRDLSLNNIMIVVRKMNELVGVLCDWDHCSKVVSSYQGPHQAFRTGTWQFMSIGMLQNPNKAHDILDDYESLFWAYLYGAVHGYSHNTDHKIELKMFDEQTTNERRPSAKVGGQTKRAMLPLLAEGGLRFTSSALTDLVKSIAARWNKLYTLQNHIHQLEIEKAAPQRKGKSKSKRLQNILSDISEPESQDAVVDDPLDTSTAAQEEFDRLTGSLAVLKKKLSSTVHWATLFSEATDETSGWLDDAVEDPYPPQPPSVTTKMEHTSQQTTHMTASQMAAFQEDLAAAQKARALAVASVAAHANKPPTNDVRPILVGPEDVALDDQFRHIFGLDPTSSKTAWTGLHPRSSSPLSSAAQPGWSLFTTSSSASGSKRSLNESDDQDQNLNNDLSEDDDEPASYPASKKPRKHVGLLFPALDRGGTGASGSNDVFE